jgi:hypothetical protein
MPAGEGPVAPQPAQATPSPEVPVARPGDDGGFDVSFSPSASAQLAAYGTSAPVASICVWCNEPLPSGNLPRCPRCGAQLEPPEGTHDVPGLTSIPGRTAGFQPQLVPPSSTMSQPGSAGGSPVPRSQVSSAAVSSGRQQGDPSAYEGLTPEEIALLADSSVALREEIAKLNPHDAYQPPSRDVRKAMLEIEFEADRADPWRIVDPGPLAERRRDEEQAV